MFCGRLVIMKYPNRGESRIGFSHAIFTIELFAANVNLNVAFMSASGCARIKFTVGPVAIILRCSGEFVCF